jgi:type II secretory pathway pseudopilin PulG
LIELLVVMGIILLLAAALVPAVTSLSKSNNLNTSGRLVSNLLTSARSEAINQRRLVQVRVVTKWLDSAGTEDTSASYRKFSVWRKPQAEDTQQSADPNDPYVQISKWETLPAGITFEKDTSTYTFAPTTDPKYPGTYFLDTALSNTKIGIKVPSGTANIAWIEFTPTGTTSFTGAIPNRVYMLVTEAFWNGTSMTSTHSGHSNWFAATVDTLVGRVGTVRP